MALFVFGAGATRGCSFVDPCKNPCIPPLDRDFFTQLQRIKHHKHQSLVTEVMRDVVRIFGLNFDVTMENVFTTVEHTRRMIELTGDTRDFRQTELTDISKRLRQAIAAVFEESLCIQKSERGTRKARTCAHHRRFVRNCVEPLDSIISFNYDCVLDSALTSEGAGKWNSRYGYGFKLGNWGTALRGDAAWQPKHPAHQTSTVRLLKLHGSLNFQIENEAAEDSPVRLKARPYTKQKGEMRFSIIPPEWHKRFNEGVFAHLWKQASDAIYSAEHVVFIGYSLPPTDLHSTALFRTSVRKGRLKSLVVVNPDPEARKRTRTCLQRGFTDDTRVLSFDSLAEFASADRSLWAM